MSVTTIKSGTLYMSGVAINYSNAPISYVANSVLELKSSSSNSNEIIEFVSFTDGLKVFLISTKNILNNISYDDLAKQAWVFGNTIITFNNVKYRIRLLKSDEYDRYVCNSTNLNNLLSPTTQDKTLGAYTDSTITSSASNNLWHWWKSTSLTQDIVGTNVAIRGGSTIDATSTIDKTSKNTTTGFRIVLEKYNAPPTISGTDSTLGSFSQNFTKIYTVTDPEQDLFNVEEQLNGIKIRELLNQSSKTEITLTLSDQWNSLSVGRHVIKILVTDSYGNLSTRQWIFNKVALDSGTSTNLTRPIIVTPNNSTSLKPMDATTDYTINFSIVGGELYYASEINIVDNDNSSAVVYSKKDESFGSSVIIPSNVLTNGKTYQIKVRTYNSSNQYSQWSDSVLVKTLTPPELMITTIIDGKIENPNPVIIATYYQAENDTLYKYIYNLYKDGVLIASSSDLLDGLLQYQFSNLENKTNYEIELKVVTASGMEWSLRQYFYSFYLQTKLPAVLKLENDKSTGSNKITTYVRQILGRVESGDNVTYINGEWCDTHSSVLIWDADSAFRLEGNWTAKIWARDLEDNDVILVRFQFDELSYIELTRWDNVFYLSKYVAGIKLYELNSRIEGDILSTDELYFYIQNDVDLGLMNFDTKRVTGGRSTWFSFSNLNDTSPSYFNENGFLTNFQDNFKNLLLDNVIDGQISKIYIPTVGELINANTASFLGTAVLGIMDLGSSESIELGGSQSYFTRSIDELDSTKLQVFNNNGGLESYYPNEKLGIRFVIQIPNTVKVTTFKDTVDNFYSISLSVLNLFNVQNISNLNVGDKVKMNSIKYNNEIIKFTLLSKTDNTAYLLSDVLNTTKEFDNSELTHVKGNTNWNLSNIKQWLNSNVKIG